MVDFLGKAFAVGQVVVYPGRASSSLWMNQGEIIAIDEVKKTIIVKPLASRTWRSDKPGVLSALDRVVIIS